MGTTASVALTTSATTGTSSVGCRPATSPSAPASRPLVSVRSKRNSSDDDLIQLLRMQLLQGQTTRGRHPQQYLRQSDSNY
ncbi:hypothetical protein PF005_g19705 [Phytophthora fragariae]|uniref:Uncharacterized protein n=1 Tax=Phytophthora fragariae TaxID=53985 RepID=A0A6A3DWC7_9STRA|nr:hypothetical protein PF003_g12698 [Phytophthora fragariae]KAE8922770.1 hypothetical protein PF009_g26967 [Phytophthora fragariae]KAE9088150.1 hypothetical protein PF006_g25649 [Phytophthora fragariae]KAE9088870.1 hypothetical protein PF007_g19812 [Phytophthora fragariae]KAE9183969.1 hypothetical protein PF002_g26560 [Phytophthora fragariae]